ncbi:MAG: non-ribosomal peptide synthetase, partial [Streptosporangiaceae bacterium]
VRASVVVTGNGPEWPAGTPVVDWPAASRPGTHPVRPAPCSPDDVAWLVATSGSTGTPKITGGTHRSLRNRCAWAWDTFPYTRDEVAALRTPVGFVDAIAEAAVPLLAGAPLAIVPDRSVWDAREVAGVLQRHRVTRLLGTPSMLRNLLDAVPDLDTRARALRWCTASGEPFDAGLRGRLRAVLPECRLVNLYGSSEVAADVTWADVTNLPAGWPTPIGRPIANARMVVVGGDGEIVPPGTPGELVVTGDPVGPGYLAAGRLGPSGGFRAAPDGGHGYWTGDLGWLAPDGNFYFAGRRDRQVKIRGCRVELGQVEAALLRLPGVRAAAAWTDRSHGSTERICAVVTPQQGTVLAADGLLAGLRDRLPGYMVPARIVAVDALPLSANGKLDRAEAARLTASLHPAPGEEPGLSASERRLRLLWSSLLGGEMPGPDDNFFALGGDSLAANTMLAAVMRETGVLLDVADFLAEPTIRAIAARLEGAAVADWATGEHVR